MTEVLHTMEDHQVRGVPVIESHRLAGEADLARHLPEQAVAEFAEAICANA